MKAAEWIKKVLPVSFVNKLRRLKRKIEQRPLAKHPPMPLSEFENVLRRQLGISSGQTLFVHSGFGGLKIEGTPGDVVRLLIDIVGPTGNILMPFYPVKASYEWLLTGQPFNLREWKTSMGAVAIAFGQTEGVRKSRHPTKSVAVWGKDRDWLIDGHEQSRLPYSESSPYFKITKLTASRIIGLGVGAERLSCVHAAVDTTPDYPIQPYHPNPLKGQVTGYDGETTEVWTYAHDLALTAKEDVPKFLRETGCPTYKEIVYKGRVFFCVDARVLVSHTIEQGKAGKTFFFPRSLNYQQPKRTD